METVRSWTERDLRRLDEIIVEVNVDSRNASPDRGL